MAKKNIFLDLSRREQADIVRLEMKGGGSFGSVAAKYGVKRGRIAGICRDFNIATQRSAKRPPLKLAVNEASQCVARTNGSRCAYEKQPGSEYCGRPEHQALSRRTG